MLIYVTHKSKVSLESLRTKSIWEMLRAEHLKTAHLTEWVDQTQATSYYEMDCVKSFVFTVSCWLWEFSK